MDAMTDEPAILEDAPPRAEPRRRLEALPSRQRITGEQAAARSKLVRRLRIALPAVALVLVAGLFLNTRNERPDDAFLEDFKDMTATPDEYQMAKPSFAGVDSKGKPYEIKADRASQAAGNQEVVELVRPRAVTRGPDEETEVSAERGVFRTDTSRLDLSDEVTLRRRIGNEVYVLKTPAATVSMSDETVLSDAGVEGSSEAGSLRADRMRAYNAEGRMVLEGNVRMRIYPKKLKLGEERKTGEEPAGNGTPQ
jgi:lipopolysaccharide export system protein LptC